MGQFQNFVHGCRTRSLVTRSSWLIVLLSFLTFLFHNTLIGLEPLLHNLDCVPVDGIVTGGRTTIDELSFTRELLPVTKLHGSQVAARSMNLTGTLTVEVQRPGGETAIGDIVCLVEEAQSREAPVQR